MDAQQETIYEDIEMGGNVAPPESQFSLNWQMIDGYGGNVQVTMRGSYVSEWPEIMRERKTFCEKAQLAGWTFPGNVKPTATAPAFVTVAPNTTATPAPAPVGATSTTTPANGNGVQTLKTSTLKVVPRPDGKVDLEFWNVGRQYAEIKAVKSPEQAAAMLSATGAWTPDSFKKAETYQLAASIEWAPGKPNSKGNPFKDILAVKPA